jgi:uncharacterized protein (DUF2249 family)
LPPFKDTAPRAQDSAPVSAHTRVVDVRPVPLWRRLPSILAAFDALAPGEAIELVVDLDPWPLRGYFDATRPCACDWQPVTVGPPAWRVRLTRRT